MNDIVKKHSLSFGGASIEAPSTWREITHELDLHEPPFTFADQTKDVGALQFSIAHYRTGPIPDPSPADLLALAEELGVSRGLTDPCDKVAEDGPLRLGAVSFHGGEDFIRIWYVSDGRNFAKITYVCEWGMQSEQLEECEAIVRSLRFC